MATILQRQLAEIASKSTHQLDLKAKRAAHGKSLLFDPKVAVSQDFNSLYQICIEGYEELCSLDPRFAAYSTSIFSEQSKTEEREQMTVDQNTELDAVIESFLGLVGARLLLKPAQKAVEWLVRRFKIHEHNIECLILTFLPYHSTPLFLSLLSILPPQLPQAFRFLYPSITAVQALPLHTILYTATNNHAFFSAFNQYVLKVAKARHQSSVLVSFWVSVTTQAVDGMISAAQSGREAIHRQRQEDLMLRILPVLNQGLSMRDIPELITGCCVITTVLAAKGHLEDHVLDGMMEALATGWTTQTIDVRVTCLGMLAGERSAAELAQPVLRKLFKFDQFLNTLISASRQYKMDRLALGFVLGCIKRLLGKKASASSVETVEEILHAGLMNSPELKIVIRSLFSTAQNLRMGGSLTPEQQANFARLLTLFAEWPLSSELFQRALKKSPFSQDELELSIQTVLPRQIEPVTLAEDATMEDAPLLTVRSDFDTAIATVANMKPRSESFLFVSASEEFGLLYPTFLHSLSSKENLHRFIEIPAVNRTSSIAFASFYVRVFTGNTPQTAKCAALRVLAAALDGSQKQDIDFQALIPYLVVALMDRSASVRRAATECTTALSQYYNLLADSPTVVSLGDEKDFNPSSTDVENGQNAIKGLVQDVLAPNLQECVMDADMVSTVLITALNGSTSSRKGQVNADVPDLKSARRTAIFAFLARHASTSPLLHVRTRVLTILNQVGKIGSPSRTQILLPWLKQWLGLDASHMTTFSDFGRIALPEFDAEIFRVISTREQDGIELLKQILDGSVTVIRHAALQAAHSRIKEVWSSLKAGDREFIVLALLEAALLDSTDASDAAQIELAMETLRALTLPTEALVALVDSLLNTVALPSGPPAKKRRRTSHTQKVDVNIGSDQTTLTLRKYTTVLELVDNSSPENHSELLKGLFQVLEEIERLQRSTGSTMVYLQGLTINSLLAIVDALKEPKDFAVDRNAINQLVECVKETSNPQVQNAALLLISGLAEWVPDVVLHGVMPVFTHMGKTILRQGDEYSAHVIDQTVSRVVPLLVASSHKKGRNIAQDTSAILLSFTAAFEHIPAHRRLDLFKHVADAIGPQDGLHAIIAMIMDRYPTDNQARRFVADLVNSFEPNVVLATIRQYVALVTDCFKQTRQLSDSLLNLKGKPTEDAHATANNLLDGLANLLDNTLLRSRFVMSFDADLASNQRSAFSQLMEDSIRLTQFLGGRPHLAQSSTRVMSNIFKLLPTVDLIKCAETLLDHNEDDIRHVVLHSVDAQVGSIRNSDLNSTTALLEFVPRVTSLIQKSSNVALKHGAIGCIDRITEHVGKKDPNTILESAQIIAGEGALRDADDELKIVSMLCLATMVDVLQDDFIPFLPLVLPQVFTYLRSSMNEESSPLRINMVNAGFALINAVAEHLAYMFTGKYLDNGFRIAQLSAHARICSGTRKQFYRLVGAIVGPSEIFSAFNRNYSAELQQDSFEVIEEYFDTVKTAILSRPRSVIKSSSTAIFELLLKAFDHRRLAEADSEIDFDLEEIDQIESVYIDVAFTTVTRIDDTTFRPFFLRLVEWTGALPKKDANGRIARATVLYKFLAVIFGQLKALMTSYSSYIIESSSDILQHTSSSSQEGLRLLTAVLSALEQTFEYDKSEFWQSPAHFTPISTALTTLLSTSKSRTLTPYLTSTITTLAAATNSQDQHKELNSAILKLMRSDDAEVRLAAVKTEMELTEGLGEVWLGMVPEMLPFVSELLEDEEGDVEREAKRWVGRVEELLGESLEL
ncbi:U3 small nucleolar RNA-associated protein 10 [Tothia fuscella]|uniref:U3 small nucleolar RNA-associated protein 10 n=1 Tax=Tothia fuscella TaxID=1048955 RepID=A0A9P4NJ36_9PEZI|nr:U3 small nucleolar RNA-associated protein 10 [Tothia fuscella]